jgi:hypothetical protein
MGGNRLRRQDMQLGRYGEIQKIEGRYPRTVDGGYPVIYYCEDGAVLCVGCANGENGSLASEEQDDRQWHLIGADVFWEGAPETCEHCGASIESAYGDPKAEKEGE